MNFVEAAERVGLKIETNVPLAPLTTWKIGGWAKFFLRASSAEQIRDAIKIASARRMQFFVLGGGSNVLVSDSGYDGLVIFPQIRHLKIDGQKITAGCSVTMGRLASFSMQQNLSGLEWALGLPGTVGGAVFGNSNCFGGSTGASLKAAVLVDGSGTIKPVEKSYFRFSYDYSRLQETREIVAEAVFELRPVSLEEAQNLKASILEAAAFRIKKQPLGEKTAGSVFKALKPEQAVVEKIKELIPDWQVGLRDNLISAGFIIDKALRLKGFVMDKMQISEIHANFFINRGGATAKNCREMIDFVKNECKNKMNITLEEEIKYLGEFK